MKYLVCVLFVLNFGCVSSRYVENPCSYSGGKQLGTRDAHLDYALDSDPFESCSLEDQEVAVQGYKDGYEQQEDFEFNINLFANFLYLAAVIVDIIHD